LEERQWETSWDFAIANMLMCRVFTFVAAMAALIIALTGRVPPAMAQEPVRQGELLQPGAPYPGMGERPIKLVPPGEIKHRTIPRRVTTRSPATAIAQPENKSPSPTPDTKKALLTLPAASPAAQQRAAAKPESFTAKPQTIGAATPQATATHGIPLALEPTSPDILIGAHGQIVGQPQATRASRSAVRPAFGKTVRQPSLPVSRVSEPQSATEQNQTPSKTRSAVLEPGLIAPANGPAETLSPELKTRTAPPKPRSQDHAGLAKRSEILFAEGAVDPGPETVTDLRKIAPSLTAALKGTARIQLEAFGGAPGDKSSDARRLSLKRALTVRALLIENGVPAERIDVRALGGAEDGGAPDRVDVFLRSS
jgi:outer membrane protein OmpA-like peptidoglycan-associated protein